MHDLLVMHSSEFLFKYKCGLICYVKYTSRLKNKTYTLQDILEVEDSPGPVEKIIKARNIRLNGNDQRQYLVRFKNQTVDKDKWLAEDAIPDVNLHLRRFKASRWAEQSHQ
ncbi:hypothetical protein O181_028801 [Austropuccinia psidii MF-1]|uniref:Chromo domain-containing protein n=1 Tax=Austropuccinia psidii MF-1 TaxID=1389203 RepID=A0A9Q3H2Q9_9BASI|nr:hypothetical protein [Austropuccinia psidii MF-1]